jgi:hypothetical protein
VRLLEGRWNWGAPASNNRRVSPPEQRRSPVPTTRDSTVIASTIGMAITVLASPAMAAESLPVEPSVDSPATLAPANGDGRLSDDEITALGLLPVAEVTGEDLRDVSEVDLSRLPAALRDRIQQPVALEYAEAGNRDGFNTPTATTYTKQVVGQWWHENAFGWHLTDYYIAASFSYDGAKVIEPSDWSWGNGHWGYQFCREDARGNRWVSTKHAQYQAFGRGSFGPPGCDIITMTNGGTLNVDGGGRGWLS